MECCYTVTGYKRLMEVIFSNGSIIKCTPYHKFFIKVNGIKVSCRADHLRIGDMITWFCLPEIDEKNGGYKIINDIFVVDIKRTGEIVYYKPTGIFNGIEVKRIFPILVKVVILGSTNLSNLYGATFNDYENTTRHFLNNVIIRISTLFLKVEEMTKGFRRIGIGVMGFDLIKTGLPYDSPEALTCRKYYV